MILSDRTTVGILFLLQCLELTLASDYYGTYVGDFQNRFHGVGGEVYAVDSRTLFIRGFRWRNKTTTPWFSGRMLAVNHFVMSLDHQHLIVIKWTDWELTWTMTVIVLIVNTFITSNPQLSLTVHSKSRDRILMFSWSPFCLMISFHPHYKYIEWCTTGV